MVIHPKIVGYACQLFDSLPHKTYGGCCRCYISSYRASLWDTRYLVQNIIDTKKDAKFYFLHYDTSIMTLALQITTIRQFVQFFYIFGARAQGPQCSSLEKSLWTLLKALSTQSIPSNCIMSRKRPSTHVDDRSISSGVFLPRRSRPPDSIKFFFQNFNVGLSKN